MTRPKHNRAGMTIVELLIGMSILTTFLAVISAFLVNSQQFSRHQMVTADTNTAIRLAQLRMTEVIQQSNYIYPAGVTLDLMFQVNGRNRTRQITTGSDALAVLVPKGTSYCSGGNSNQNYCAFVYSLQRRSGFGQVFSRTEAATNRAVIEFKVLDFDWPEDTIPSLSLGNASWGVILDSVNASATSLGAAGNLEVTTSRSSYDFNDVGDTFTGTTSTDTDALVQAVSSTLAVLPANGSGTVTRSNYVFSRSIPRNAPPGQ